MCLWKLSIKLGHFPKWMFVLNEILIFQTWHNCIELCPSLKIKVGVQMCHFEDVLMPLDRCGCEKLWHVVELYFLFVLRTPFQVDFAFFLPLPTYMCVSMVWGREQEQEQVLFQLKIVILMKSFVMVSILLLHLQFSQFPLLAAWTPSFMCAFLLKLDNRNEIASEDPSSIFDCHFWRTISAPLTICGYPNFPDKLVSGAEIVLKMRKRTVVF